MDAVIVQLSISAHEFERLYAGAANTVMARTVDGRSVSFPAHVLRGQVAQDGVRGTFRIEFDDENRFSSIQRI